MHVRFSAAIFCKDVPVIPHTADKYISHYVEVIATNQREVSSAIDAAIGHNMIRN